MPDAKDLIFRSVHIRNGEPRLQNLAKNWLTPQPYFYVRSHASNPAIDVNTFRLEVVGMVRQSGSFSMLDLSKFPSASTMATMVCAGNRRAEHSQVRPVDGVQWDAGAIGNASWQGVLMADVLNACGVLPEARHVWFEGLDQIDNEGETIGFGASIPIEKGLTACGSGAPLLCHSMNGKPLTHDHGFPLRSIVPGYIGARSVKWLGKIIVSDRPSPNYFMADDYKLVGQMNSLDWSEAGPIYRFPINAVICNVETKPDDWCTVSGYALPTSREGCRISKVEVSVNGVDWHEASLGGDAHDYCWQLWKIEMPVAKGSEEILVRAEDTSGNFMPERVVWNAKGYLQNAWHRFKLKSSD